MPILASILILGAFTIGLSFDDAFAKQEKVTICHKPGTVDEETKKIPVSALNGHLGHGDAEGDCIVAENRPPTISTILITPTLPFTTDNLFCDVVGADPDGDPISFSYEWRINAVLDGTEFTSTYPSSKFTKGDVVECTVIPNDGIEDGTSGSSVVTIQNSAPTIGSVTITPDDPTYSSTPGEIIMTCSGSGVFDLDGDPVTFTYLWSAQGFPELGTGNTFDLVGFPLEALLTCTVTPFDGIDFGEPVSDSVFVTIDPNSGI